MGSLLLFINANLICCFWAANATSDEAGMNSADRYFSALSFVVLSFSTVGWKVKRVSKTTGDYGIMIFIIVNYLRFSLILLGLWNDRLRNPDCFDNREGSFLRGLDFLV